MYRHGSVLEQTEVEADVALLQKQRQDVSTSSQA
ncbi:hypothetical protein P308_27895 [Pseudomonas piscis]|nr:hypothetical protein P308_27895 [Pseudomonas piscis]